MDTLIKADIFFFITGIAVVVVTLLCAVAVFYCIKLVRTLERLARELEQKADRLDEDARELLRRVRDSFIFNLLFFPRKRSKNKEK